jgi:transcription termination factor Rho
MSVLDRAALDQSPLADLHAIASELSIDGYRRLRRPELIETILGRQSGGDEGGSSDEAAEAAEPAAPAAAEDAAGEQPAPDDSFGPDVSSEPGDSSAPVDSSEPGDSSAPDDSSASDDDQPSGRRRRGRRGGRGRSATREDEPPAKEQEEVPATPRDEEETMIEGVVELLPNGSGFLRVEPPEPSDDDVYISGAQVKRCELVSGDSVSGPRRAPRRSERFASLVRIDTVNGLPAGELSSGPRFDDLPAAFPDDRFRLGSDDPTVKAIEWLTPFGRGSRVTIVGAPRAGKSEAVRRLATALAADEGLQLSVALAGVRPEEISEWGRGPIVPTAAVSFAAPPDTQGHTVELVVDQARRIAARGAHAVVFVDTLDGLHPHAARKALAAARNIVDGGSLTVIATASEPIGGETTVIALDASLASTGRFPALDLAASGTVRPELLVGEAGSEAIARARAEAIEE